MRYLKLFLILCIFPIFAEEATETPSPAVQNEQPAPEKKEEEPKEEKVASTPEKENEQPASTEKKTPHQDLEKEVEPVDILDTTESYETAFIKTIVVLVALLVLILLTIWMFKKISNGRLQSFNSLKSIKILEKRPLSPKSMLYLVEVGGKQVLLAESQLEVRSITTLDWLDTEKDL